MKNTIIVCLAVSQFGMGWEKTRVDSEKASHSYQTQNRNGNKSNLSKVYWFHIVPASNDVGTT